MARVSPQEVLDLFAYVRLYAPEDFFQRGVRGKRIKPTFVASSDGVVASVDVEDDETKH